MAVINAIKGPIDDALEKIKDDLNEAFFLEKSRDTWAALNRINDKSEPVIEFLIDGVGRETSIHFRSTLDAFIENSEELYDDLEVAIEDFTKLRDLLNNKISEFENEIKESEEE